MRLRRTVLLTALLAAGLAAAPATRAQTAMQGQTLARALDHASVGNWTAAAKIAAGVGGPATDIVLWLRLREGGGSWAEYRSFALRHPSWPNLTTLRRHSEGKMPAETPAAEVVAFYAAEAPMTGAGVLRLAAALTEIGRPAEAEALVAEAWRGTALGLANQAAVARAYPEVVAPLDVARTDMLLWRGLTSEASGMLDRLPADWRKLAEARIAVRAGADGSTALIEALPATVRGDPGLVYERYLYRVGKGRWDEAEAYLLKYSTSAEALGQPDLWMERRANLARGALRRGEVATAYALAAQNYGTKDSGADYADAEWVAGFVALTAMDNPTLAVEHFARFQAAVATPISLGRAGYWLGRARQAAGDAEGAQAAYAEGAKHQTSFYGQLAALAAGVPSDPRLAGAGPAPDWRALGVRRNSVVEAAAFLQAAGDDARALQFLRHAAEGMPAEARAALAQMAIDLDRPHVGVRLAKDAAAKGLVLPDQYYPLHDIAGEAWPVPAEFALAIARQESEFNPAAVSSAGARGLMQLMPATAEEVAGKLAVAYDARALTADPLYNARLGTAYLARMYEGFGGSYVLAAAAYNAGPGRVSGWLATLGDPRRPGADTVAWIESIPFEETRNYVMRVLESLHVYRARLQGEAQPIRLASDIGGAT